jgi:hypothetical protein
VLRVLSERPFRLAGLAAVIVAAGVSIAYRHVWEDGGAKPLVYRDLTPAIAPLEPPVPTERRFDQRGKLASYVRSVRTGGPGPLPRIDFSRDEALLVATGPRSSAGYAVRIVSVDEERGRVLVTAREETPTLRQAQQGVVTYPYRLIVFRNTHKPVYLHLQGRQ